MTGYRVRYLDWPWFNAVASNANHYPKVFRISCYDFVTSPLSVTVTVGCVSSKEPMS